jgi:Flp pilus assembly protein TadD
VQSMQRVCRLAPTSAAARCDLGKIYRKWGKVPKAMAEYRVALRLDPKYAKAHLLLGLAHAAEGRCKAARRAFTAFSRAEPSLSLKALQKLIGRCKAK